MAAPPRQHGPPAHTIRWDRVGRICLAVLFIGVALLYVRPAISWFQTRGESASRQQEVRSLQQDNERLRHRKKVLSSEAAVENEARRKGMVKPGERAYVVKGLPDN